MKTVRLVCTVIAAAALAAGSPAHADKCTGAKLKAVGKKEAGLLDCQAKAAATGAPPGPGLAVCEAIVKSKFSTAFGKAGTCAVGDEMTCEDIADNCESTVSTAMTDILLPGCEAAKRKAAGKLAKGELGCYSKAATKSLPVDTVVCIPKAQGKFSAALTKAGACPDGGSPQNLVEDNCVQPAVATGGGGMVTDVCPTTTTTTTITTTSTTTTTTTTSTTTTSTSSSTTTTSSTFPPCTVDGAPCGSCGNGICAPLCGQGCNLACVVIGGTIFMPCTTDSECPSGRLCITNSGGCPSQCGGGNNGCDLPCP